MTRIDTAQEATSSRSKVYAALDKGMGLELLAKFGSRGQIRLRCFER